MTVKVRYSRRAAAEVEAITAYLRGYSEAAAQHFDEALARAERQLARFPNSGRPGTRRLIVGNYIVSYRRRGDEIEIFAVRHGRRSDARF
jgi:addiction module RelE/StbE family toxin